MNPNEFLREPGYQFAVLSTYSFDPFFFERLVLPSLWAGGSKSVIVYADAREVRRALAQPVGTLRHLGRRYFLIPVESSGAFHPKVFLRLGHDGGLAWVGSGNLTRGGWGANSELASTWALGSDDGDPGLWLVPWLRSLANSNPRGLSRELISRVEGIDWIVDTPAGDQTPVLFSFERSLSEQLAERWEGRRFDRLWVLTGSTDRDGAMIRWAREALGVTDVRMCVSPERASLEPGLVGALPVDMIFVAPPHEKLVHAKFFWFDGADGPAAVWGSANCSRAAWLPEGNNVEAVVVSDRPDTAAFAEFLNVFSTPGLSAEEVLTSDPDSEDPVTEQQFRIVTAEWDPSTDTVRVEIDPAVPTASKCFLCLRDLMIPMQGEDRRWEGSPDGALATHQTPVGFVRIESPDGTSESSSAHWIESPHELREVLTGRDFRSTLSGLLEQESKEADYRLAHELGRIGLELIRDSAAYPDLRISGKRRKSNEDSEPRMIDPATLIASLASCENEAGPLGSGAHSGFGISGVFRAIFSRLDQDHDETEVIDDEGSPGAPEPPEIPPPPVETDDRTRAILKKHIAAFFEALDSDEFPASCSANQLVQATCYPIAVALMGTTRSWCSDPDKNEWIGHPIRRLLQSDPFNHKPALLELVKHRYVDEDRHDAFLEAVGDGQLWLTLMVGIESLSGDGAEGVLSKLTLFNQLFEHQVLLAQADLPRVEFLYRHFHDPEVIRAARRHVAEAGELLHRIEGELRNRSKSLIADLDASDEGHKAGDLIWSENGGWGLVRSDEHADKVVTYMARSGDERTIKSTGWLVNVTRLSTQEASREELPSQLRSLLRVVGRDADVAW